MSEIQIKEEKAQIRQMLKECIFECKHLETEVRKMRTKNGQIQIRSQCKYCGASMSDPISHNKFSTEEIDNLPEYDHEIKEKRGSLYSEIYGALSEHVNMKYGGGFWDRHHRHLTSEKWNETRQAVIDRANGTCELCGKRKIQHVHHTNYDHLGNEPLSDLLGVCVDCHRKLHPDRII